MLTVAEPKLSTESVSSSRHTVDTSFISGLGQTADPDRRNRHWNWFVQEFSDLIFRQSLRVMSASDADEVTQRVLTSMDQKIRRFSYEKGNSFRAWLKTVVSNTIRDYWRQRQRERLTSAESLPELSDERGESLIDEIMGETDLPLKNLAMREVLAELPDEDQRIAEGMLAKRGAKAIAAEVDLSTAAVFKRWHRIKEAMRERFDRMKGDE